jgi:hypothetical protein
VDGTTYDQRDGKIHDWPVGKLDSNMATIGKIEAVCNDCTSRASGHCQWDADGGSSQGNGFWTFSGEMAISYDVHHSFFSGLMNWSEI